MNTNIQLIQYQLLQKLSWDERREYEGDHLRLSMNKERTREDELKLSEILAKIEVTKKKTEMAMNRVAEAERNLQSNQCEDQQTSSTAKKSD
jgi:hypothetical protein